MIKVKEFVAPFTWKVPIEIKSVGYNAEDYGMFHMNTVPEELKYKNIYLVEVTENGVVQISVR